MKLRTFLVTTGEPVTLEAIARLKKFTPVPFDLTIWFDSCGRGVNKPLLEKLAEFTDDIILLSKNHYATSLGYAFLYLDFDYLLLCFADNLVKENYYMKLESAFSRYPKVASAGQAYFESDYEFLVSHPDIYPDGIQMISKEAVNDVGGMCPSLQLNSHGHDLTEFHKRCLVKGWNYVAIKDLLYLDKDTHETRDKLEDLQERIEMSNKTYRKAMDMGFMGYNWWTNNLQSLENICL